MTNHEWLTVPNKEQHEYIIGIDFGHGETSAAFCPIGWNMQDGELEGVKDIDFGNNSKVIPSAISITDEGRVYIGEAAFFPEILNKAKVNVCFKKRPENIDGEQEQLMIQYMRAVYQLICEKNNALFTNGNHIVCIAAPSGWSQETMLVYSQMAHRAGLPIFDCVSESRAAFIKAQQDVSSGLPQYINQGAVVFDMVSSTLDFTYLRENEICDYGYDCGASRVEKLIYSELREDNEDIVSFEQQHPHLVAKLLFEARSAKEGVYFHPETRFKRTVNFEDIVDDEEFEDAKMKFIYEPGELNRTLQSNGYIDEIRRAMIDFKQNHINGKPIYVAFLTGGASRMDFIKPLVSECWGLPEDKIYRDQDPSLTISRGTADTGRMIARAPKANDTQVNSINEQIEYWRDQLLSNFNKGFWSSKEELCFTLIASVRQSLYIGTYDFTQWNGNFTLYDWYAHVCEVVNEEDASWENFYKEKAEQRIDYQIRGFQEAIDSHSTLKDILPISKSNISIPQIKNKLREQLDKIWATAQAIEIGELVSLFSYFDNTEPSSFTEELSRIIINSWCEELLDDQLSYLYQQRSILGQLSDGLFGQTQDKRRIDSVVIGNLSNSARKAIWRSLDISNESDFFTRENDQWVYLDTASQTAQRYVASFIHGNSSLQKEIEKLEKMCKDSMLTYFDSYVAELRTKL